MFHATTILAVRHGNRVVVVGDGQVSFGQTVLKHSARKVRKVYHDRVIAGFAGATADAFTLFEKFEAKLEQYNGNLKRAAVELAKDWRTDRMLRRLEALLVVAQPPPGQHDRRDCPPGNGPTLRTRGGSGCSIA